MIVLLFGQTLVFWSGWLAAISVITYFITCYISPLKCSGRSNDIKCKIHAYAKWPAYFFVALHIILALQATLG